MIELNELPEAWRHCLQVVRPALLLAPPTYLQDLQDCLAADGIQAAVDRQDSAAAYNWIVRLLARQGISNAAAEAFAEQNGSPTWEDISERMGARRSVLACAPIGVLRRAASVARPPPVARRIISSAALSPRSRLVREPWLRRRSRSGCLSATSAAATLSAGLTIALLQPIRDRAQPNAARRCARRSWNR